jgi:hypothetical protein
MSVTTISDIKNRFASMDMPSAKDFSDMIDTVLANAISFAKTEVVTPAYVTGWTSVPTAFTVVVTTISPMVIANSVAAIPNSYTVSLRNVSADGSYNVNDEVPISEFTTSSFEPAFTVKVSTANFTITANAASNAIQVGSYVITLSKWQAVVRSIIPTTSGIPVLAQPVAPNATYAGSIWIKTDATSGAPLRAYNYYSGDGYWHARHPIPPGTTVAVLDTSWTVPSLATYDGGGSPGMGAMWQLASSLTNRFIFGADPSTYIIGSSGGEITHLLTSAEAGVDPLHRHGLGQGSSNFHQMAFELGGTLSPGMPGEAVGGSGDVGPAALSSVSTFGPYTFQTDVPGSPQTVAPHNNMPPYVAAYFIQRTSRLDYVEAPGP